MIEDNTNNPLTGTPMRGFLSKTVKCAFYAFQGRFF